MPTTEANFFSVCLYAYGGHVAPKLGLLRPGCVLLGHDIWNDAIRIYNACGTAPWLILRWMDLNINVHTPEQAANFICAKARELMVLGVPKVLAHGLNEQYTNRLKARDWELRFIARCHDHWGIQTVCSNYPFANFDDHEAQDFKDVWRESDYNGPHRYDLYENGAFHPRIETSLRYRKWRGYPIEKDLCTEFGIEDGGWQKLSVSPELMQERMLENVFLWKNDGARASHFFCMAHTNELKWGPYYALDSMYQYWGKNSPNFEPGGNVPVPQQLLDAMEKCLEGQREHNRALQSAVAGLKNQGEILDSHPKRYGDIYNLLDEVKKVLSPVVPLSISEATSLMASGLTPHSPQNLGGPGHPDS